MTTSGLISALDVYDGALAAHLAGLPPGPLLARVADRAFTQLALQRWCAAVDCADRAALDRLRMTLPGGAGVLDLGCGPGRHAAYLHNAGLCVLGVDTSAPAVALTRRAGAAALLADALGPLPRPAAGWDGVLLLDGNVGIGGDPHRLLSQVVDLLAPGGRLLVELDPDGVTDCLWLQLSNGERLSTPFRWARLAAADLEGAAAGLGLGFTDVWTQDGRQFALMTRSRDSAPGLSAAASCAIGTSRPVGSAGQSCGWDAGLRGRSAAPPCSRARCRLMRTSRAA